MSAELPEPERWSERVTRGAAAETAAGAAFRRLRQATEPPDEALARLAARLDAPPRASGHRLAWRLAVAAALLLAMGGTVGAALHRWRRAHSATVEGTPANRSLAAATDGAHGRHARRAPMVAPEAETTEEAASVVAPAPPGPPPTEAPAGQLAAAAKSPGPHARGASGRGAPLPEIGEAAALAGAFRELRSGGDATAALRSLDEYDRRFPAGALRTEARIARVEALIALDRRRDALPLLEAIEDGGGALTRNVRITRGELRAEAGRCPEALRDFDAVLAVSERDAAGARALYGRASCRSQAGDVARAREDLARYLALHPDGAFAAAARRQLAPPP